MTNVRIVREPRNGTMYYFPQWEAEHCEFSINPFKGFINRYKCWKYYILPIKGTAMFDTEHEALRWLKIQTTPSKVVWTGVVND
jgi:hypothetical protein